MTVIHVKDVNKAISCFREIDFSMELSNFEHRLIANKLICLLELKGINIGYSFNLHVRGPYSPDLADDYYKYSEKFRNLDTNISLSQSEKDLAIALKDLFGTRSSLLEIGSTYGFMTNYTHLSPSEAYMRVKRMKFFYTNSQIAIGISKAKQYLFEPSAEDMDILKRETDPWKRVSLSSMRI